MDTCLNPPTAYCCNVRDKWVPYVTDCHWLLTTITDSREMSFQCGSLECINTSRPITNILSSADFHEEFPYQGWTSDDCQPVNYSTGVNEGTNYHPSSKFLKFHIFDLLSSYNAVRLLWHVACMKIHSNPSWKLYKKMFPLNLGLSEKSEWNGWVLTNITSPSPTPPPHPFIKSPHRAQVNGPMHTIRSATEELMALPPPWHPFVLVAPETVQQLVPPSSGLHELIDQGSLSAVLGSLSIS